MFGSRNQFGMNMVPCEHPLRQDKRLGGFVTRACDQIMCMCALQMLQHAQSLLYDASAAAEAPIRRHLHRRCTPRKRINREPEKHYQK